jgi:ankyrin repeat protein
MYPYSLSLYINFNKLIQSSMAACNKFGESILHLACRRASFEVVEFLLNNGGDALAVDDFGRTPFHDACWRSDPRFDIISLLLQKDKSLLRYKDVRGSLGLNYVLEENWLQFCAFFFHQRDRYFPIVTGPDIAIESEKST